MCFVRVKEILEEKNKTKYWFVKNMDGSYQSLTKLLNNETTSIRFETLEKMCNVLECEPGDIIIRRKNSKRRT